MKPTIHTKALERAELQAAIAHYLAKGGKLHPASKVRAFTAVPEAKETLTLGVRERSVIPWDRLRQEWISGRVMQKTRSNAQTSNRVEEAKRLEMREASITAQGRLVKQGTREYPKPIPIPGMSLLGALKQSVEVFKEEAEVQALSSLELLREGVAFGQRLREFYQQK